MSTGYGLGVPVRLGLRYVFYITSVNPDRINNHLEYHLLTVILHWRTYITSVLFSSTTRSLHFIFDSQPYRTVPYRTQPHKMPRQQPVVFLYFVSRTYYIRLSLAGRDLAKNKYCPASSQEVQQKSFSVLRSPLCQ
jgi:hypothetical protein